MANQTLNNIITRLSTQVNKPANIIHVSPQLVEAARAEVNDVLIRLGPHRKVSQKPGQRRSGRYTD